MVSHDDKKGFHHAYLGLIILLISFVMVEFTNASDAWCSVVLVLGSWVFADDYYQHYKGRTVPTYRSPMHRAYTAFIAWCFVSKHFTWLGKFIVKLNRFVDKLFGG